MTAPVEAMGFHIGMVVHDLEASAAHYTQVLGGTFQTWEFTKVAPKAVNPDLEDSNLLVSYGRMAGFTLEIIQVLEGRGLHARWLEDHGEGIQHLGFWVPDVARATEQALDRGAILTSASLDETAFASVTIRGLSPSAIGAAVLPGAAYVKCGDMPVEIEFLGPSVEAGLRRRLGGLFGTIVDPPPWADRHVHPHP